jgi:N-acylglucosamine 2-epimerase (GlcNAc 2-epimerase)
MSHSLTTRGAEIIPLVDSSPRISHWLTGCFLPHWVRRALADGRPGYAETVRQDGTPMRGRERSTLVTARLVYTFSLGHVLDAHIGCLSAADHGLDFLLHACRTTNGRFFHSVEEDGHVLVRSGSRPLRSRIRAPCSCRLRGCIGQPRSFAGSRRGGLFWRTVSWRDGFATLAMTGSARANGQSRP